MVCAHAFRVIVVALTSLLLFLTPLVDSRGGRGGGGRGFSGARGSFGRGGGRGSFGRGGGSVGGEMSRSSYYGTSYRPHGLGHSGVYYFRGFGSGHNRVDRPTITEEKMKSKFNPRLHTGSSFGSGFFAGYLVEHVITQPSIPFRLEGMTYFWGSEYLPGNNSTRVEIANATSEAVNVTSLNDSSIEAN